MKFKKKLPPPPPLQKKFKKHWKTTSTIKYWELWKVNRPTASYRARSRLIVDGFLSDIYLNFCVCGWGRGISSFNFSCFLVVRVLGGFVICIMFSCGRGGVVGSYFCVSFCGRRILKFSHNFLICKLVTGGSVFYELVLKISYSCLSNW